MSTSSRTGVIVGAAFALLLAWDASGWDIALARALAPEGAFPLRDHWLLSGLLHEGGRRVSWLAAAALCVGIRWPFGPLRRLPLRRRAQLAATTLVAALAISVLKGFSTTSCPWDLAGFGGLARHVSHWSRVADGGPGHCFPAGHASSGFAFVGGYFVFRDIDARMARRWLAAALGAGLVFGLAQQARGAHFMSHTLWTAWLCFTLAWVIDEIVRTRKAQRA
ncbi:phosphatase PAP2 family protein [Ramlibacter sp.]|uniref:phosphatase PAP2 family protein n=1 Tax=Ramlibacter sp. TaxID=1917967 RepID=UPI003D0CBB9F